MSKAASAKIAKQRYMEFGADKKRVRKAEFAGMFYPGDKNVLKRLLGELFSNSRTGNSKGENKNKFSNSNLKALIVPHAGYIYSGEVAAKGYSLIPVERYQHHVVIGPSHRHYFLGVAGSPDNLWETPLGFVNQIPWGSVVDSRLHEGEHSVEVQLPFLQYVYGSKDFSVTCLLTGVLTDVKGFAMNLSQKFRNSFIVVSSDFSHYLTDSLARATDEKSLEAIKNLDSGYFLETQESACGSVGIAILIELAKILGWIPSVIAYDTSAKTSGDFSSVVGYACVGFYENKP